MYVRTCTYVHMLFHNHDLHVSVRNPIDMYVHTAHAYVCTFILCCSSILACILSVGCLPQPFLPAAGISDTFNKSCSSYSFLSTIKSTGDVVWTCSDNLQWTGDFTQCSFIEGGERSVFVLAFIVNRAELSSNQETLDSIERDVCMFVDSFVHSQQCIVYTYIHAAHMDMDVC